MNDATEDATSETTGLVESEQQNVASEQQTDTVQSSSNNTNGRMQIGNDTSRTKHDSTGLNDTLCSNVSNGTVIEDLAERWSADQKAFLDFVEVILSLNATKPERLRNRAKLLHSPESAEKIQKVANSAIERLSKYAEFLEEQLDSSISNDLKEEMIDKITKLCMLHEKFDTVIAEVQASELFEEPPLGTSEAFCTETINQTTRTPIVDTGLQDEFVNTQPRRPRSSQEDAALTGNRRSDTIRPNHQSTPWRSGMQLSRTSRPQVRFSDITSARCIPAETFSQDQLESQDETIEEWRVFDIVTTDLNILTVLDILKSIDRITRISLNEDLGDVEINALDKREQPELQKLKESLKKEIKDIDHSQLELKGYAVDAFKAACKWLEELESLVKGRNLHLNPDHKYSEPLKLEKFAGHGDVKTNIYEFLKLYEIISRGFTLQDKAHFLFSNYLSDEVKGTVRHLSDDFAKMKRELVLKYGDINRLLSTKKNLIKSLPQITRNSKQTQKVTFIKSYCEVLDQIQTLVDLNVKDYPQMEAEIFSHSNVMDLSSLLPEFLKNKFSSAYVKRRKSFHGEQIPGKVSFQMLLEIVKDEQGSLEFSVENYLDRKEDSRKQDTSSDSKKEKSIKKFGKSTSYKEDRLRKSVCFVHSQVKKKVAECQTGKCGLFLNMKPAVRREWAIKRNICELCFMFTCFKKPQERCIFKQQLPQALVCVGCGANGKDRNVLLCGEHKCNFQTVKNALKEFLVDYEDGTSVCLMQLLPVNATSSPILKKGDSYERKADFASRENDQVFDTTTGKTVPKSDVAHRINKDSNDYAIYPMQILNICGERTLVLFDSGAMGEAVKGDLAEKLKFSIIDHRLQSFRVAGGDIVHTDYPLYEATLGPDTKGDFYTFSLLGMERISERLPLIDLSQIQDEFKQDMSYTPYSKEPLPNLVGGSEIQMIIGIRQSRIFPTKLMVLPSGLQVWRSQLSDVFGSTLIFAGPHHSVAKAYSMVNMSNTRDAFSMLFTSSYNLYRESKFSVFPTDEDTRTKRNAHKLSPYISDYDAAASVLSCIPAKEWKSEDAPANPVNPRVRKNTEIDISFKALLESIRVQDSDETAPKPVFLQDLMTATQGLPKSIEKSLQDQDVKPDCDQVTSITECCQHGHSLLTTKTRAPRAFEKALQEEEETGCTVDYRCSSCAACKECKQADKLRSVSLKEEAEELLISRSVFVDVEKQETTCNYPFLESPEEFLSKKWNGKSNNYAMALSVFNSQRKKCQEVKESVVRFHTEMQEKGYVQPLKSLPAHIQEQIKQAKLVHYFVWRSVFKPGSTSTPTRLVVDPTVSSFNDLLAKGKNCIPSLYLNVINWRGGKFSFTSDISKMFNTLKLTPEMFKYSLYLFSTTLDASEPVEIWVNLTLMYGLKSAANQCTHALREVAKQLKERYPLAAEVILKWTYMDDSSNSYNSVEELRKAIQQMKDLLPSGGFKLKVITVSGETLCEKASTDGTSTTFAGYRWISKDDVIMLGTQEIDFNPKRRAVKKPNNFPVVTDEGVVKLVKSKKLKKRILLGKCLKLFDVVGLFEPLKVPTKLDLQPLKLFNYDQEVPDISRSL